MPSVQALRPPCPLPNATAETAPDGSCVHPLARTERASMAHFELAPGTITQAVRHRRLDELWFVLCGKGRLWRDDGTSERIDALEPGVSVAIDAGVRFQFRCDGSSPLCIVAATVPAWRDAHDAEPTEGRWAGDDSREYRA